LSRTPASNGNRQKFTFSYWVKRGVLSVNQEMYFTNAGGGTFAYLSFGSGNTILFASVTSSVADIDLTSTPVYRDPSAWYHIVLQVDTTQATNTNRVKLYVNGVQQTISGTYPAQNYNCQLNTTTSQNIGRPTTGTFNGYMAEYNFIDGQALTPSDFGETDAATGVWKPKAYSGTYGTNGFYLSFSDNTSTTTLGYDDAGSNDWTLNNFSVTAGAGNDSMVDSPTAYGTDTGVGGEVRGNYATLNPLSRYAGGGSVTLSEGNLKAAFTNQYGNHGTIAIRSGKWYWEAVVTSASVNSTGGGIVTTAQAGSNTSPYLGWVLDVQAGRNYYNNSFTTFASSTGVFASGDRLGVAVDMDNGKIWYAKNGTWLGTSADPAAGTGAAQTNVSGEVVPIFYEANSGFSATWEANFGQRAFAYTAPSGFKALVTTNLPTPTIGATSTTQANDYFNTVLWTGTGSTQNITGVGFQPDLVWLKARSIVDNNGLFDAVRGAGQRLLSDATNAEQTTTNVQSAFISDGFTVGNNAQSNQSGATYVAWNWKANGAGVSNTSGTITSTVSANTTSGFSVVTYTGTGSAATIGHGLGAVPSMIIVKNRDAADAWQVYHAANTAAPETDYLVLNTTAATADAADRWNDTLPTSTLFSIGNGVEVNTNTEKYVAYVFAPVAGYSAFGSYTGNGSADGPFVYTGFRPRYVLVKRTDATDSWQVYDTARDTFNTTAANLYPNLSNAEVTDNSSQNIDILSSGFKQRNTNARLNASGGTYIYMALAESPFKFSLAR
jgi:hypothetical protein